MAGRAHHEATCGDPPTSRGCSGAHRELDGPTGPSFARAPPLDKKEWLMRRRTFLALALFVASVAGVGETLRRLPWAGAKVDGEAVIVRVDASDFGRLDELPRDQWPGR
jgi:hypothetical protein